MDTISKSRITSNLDKLVKNTRCSEEFLSHFITRGIFSDEDVDTILAEKTRSGKSRTFYEILVTRTDSYEFLLNVLKTSKQSGALKALTSYNSSLKTTTTIEQKISRFSQAASYLIEFLNNFRYTILVVISQNCSITCERITETNQRCQEYSLDDFTRIFRTSELSKDEFPVINCGDGLLPKLSHEELKSSKLVYVTSRTEAQVNQELKSHTTAFKKVLVMDEEIKWLELSETFQNEISNDIKQLEFFEDFDFSSILPDLDSSSIFCFLQGIIPPFFNSTLQEDVNYYIFRHLQRRNVVSNKIFDFEGPDIFVFKNITWLRLKEKTRTKFIQLSSKLLCQGTDKVCHFIILENERDFEELHHKFTKYPIHLLRYEDEMFFWEKSYRSISAIQHVIKKEPGNQTIIPETRFLNEILQTNRNPKYPILISDMPGMGKTCLLENIGRELQKQINHGLVVFIVISQFIRDVTKRLKEKRGLALRVKSETMKQALIEIMSQNCLGVHYLEVRPEYLKELLLDGFDELPKKYMPDFFDFMTAIQSIFPTTRIWITTRPHMLIELEQRFCVLGYNIKAFEEQEQKNFLVHYWTKSKAKNIYLDKFAKICLDKIKSRLKKDEEDIAGIPLQCRLIGDVFEQHAQEIISSGQSNETRELEWPEDSRTMFALYEKLVEKKINLFYERENYKSRHVERSDVKRAHYLMSIAQLFPELEKQFKQELHTPLSPSDLFNVGFLESDTLSTVPRFIHRTFQEYFLAEFVVQALLTKYSSATLQLLENIFETDQTQFSINKASIICRCFKWNVICYFIDAIIEREDQNQHSSKISCYSSVVSLLKILPECSLKENSLRRYENNIFKQRSGKLRNIAEACAYNNFPHIFSKILRRKSIYTDKFLILCIVKSNFDATEIFEKYSSSLWEKIKVGNYTLLHLAIIQGNRTTVEFLLQDETIRKSVYNQETIYDNLVTVCILNSQNQDLNIILEKRNIMRLLSDINGDLFRINKILDGCHGLSIELAKEVLVIWSEFFTLEIYFLVYIIHYFADKCSSTQLLDILKTIQKISPRNFGKILNASHEGSHLLTKIVSNMIPDTKLLDFLKESGLIFQMINVKNSLFNLAVETKQNEIFFRWILKNLVSTPTECENLLFKSVKRCNSLGVKLILEFYKCDPNIKNSEGQTMLHQIFKANETMTLDHYQMVDILCKKGASVTSENQALETPVNKLAKTRFSSYGQNIFDLLKSLDESEATNWHFMKMKWLLHNAKYVDQETFRGLFNLDDSKKSEVISAQDSDKNTLLHLAAIQGHSTALTILLNANFDVNAQNHRTETPLHLLVFTQLISRLDWEVFIDSWKLLIDNNADVTSLNTDNLTPICLLSRKYFTTDLIPIEVTRRLLEYAFHYYRSDLLKIDKIILVIIHRFSLDIVKEVCEWFGTLYKLSRPVYEIESKLVDKDATPLDAAVLNPDVDVLEYVIKTLQCKLSLTPPPNTCIHSYILISGPEATEKYIKLVALFFPMLVNAKSENGVVPLSVEGIDDTLVRLLVSLGADVNALDNSKNTPLHWVIKHNADNVLLVTDELISLGANVNLENDMHETPLKLTLKMLNKSNMIKCIKLLVKGKADLKKIYKTKTSEDTFLHLLVKEKLITVFHDVAEFLFQEGYDKLFYERNSENKTTIQIALEVFDKSSRIKELFRKYL